MRLLNEIQARAWPATQRRLVLRFLATPLKIVGSERVSAIQVADNELVTQADGTIAARSTGRSRPLDTGLVLRSVGYRGRSEEHTSEPKSLMRTSYAGFCMKKNKPADNNTQIERNHASTH